MPAIWVAVSGHGYGHAAQVVPVLNELGKLVAGLTVVLRTTVPASFFQDRLTVPWTLQAVPQDVGCVQQGPLHIDVRGTWNAHATFHERWDERVRRETEAMQSAGPRVVVADIPYLAIRAASEAGIPAVGLANLTWNEVLSPFADPESCEQSALLAEMEQSYGAADMGIRIAPGLPLRVFHRVKDIGPVSESAPSQCIELRDRLKVPDQDCLVLLAFGGIPLPSLPWEAMEQMEGYRFVVDGSVPRPASRLVSLATLPFRFKTVLASVDVVMTKPGYGTVLDSVAAGVSVLYVRRYNFADEAPLVDFLHRYGRARELTLDEFTTGRWEPALRQLRNDPLPAPPPPFSGAAEAAAVLAEHF